MAEAAALESTGMMTVIGLDDRELATLCTEHGCEVANQLFDKGRVLSGLTASLAALDADAKAKGLGGAGLKTITQKVRTRGLAAAPVRALAYPLSRPASSSRITHLALTDCSTSSQQTEGPAGRPAEPAN